MLTIIILNIYYIYHLLDVFFLGFSLKDEDDEKKTNITKNCSLLFEIYKNYNYKKMRLNVNTKIL